MALSLFMHRLQGPSKPWLLGGTVETAATLQLSVDVTVKYPDGSSDSLPARTLALLPDGVTTTWDRTTNKFVGFTVKGSGVLSVVQESLLSSLDGSICPLCWVIEDSVHPYQLLQLLASTPSGSMTGSAQSASNVIPWGFTEVFASPDGLDVGCWLLCPSLPGSDTVLWEACWNTDPNPDIYQIVNLRLTTTGAVKIKWLDSYIRGGPTPLVTVEQDITGGTPLVPGTRYWLYAGTLCPSDAHITAQGQVWAKSGSTPGLQVATAVATGGGGATGISVTGTLGWGISPSSAYAAFPDDASIDSPAFWMSKLQVRHTTDGPGFVMLPPTADVSSGTWSALYMCRDTPGSAVSIADSVSGHDLASAGTGDTVHKPGPYDA